MTVLHSLDLSSIPADKLADILVAAEELVIAERENKIESYYPESGPLRRELYIKHLEFFEAGANFRQRLMLAANRVGKSEGVGGYELTLHLTGEYPPWWKGRRFSRPIKAWAAGDTWPTVRDILQAKLLGPAGHLGTGLIPRRSIVRVTLKAGLSDTCDTVHVAHASGGTSTLSFKSYDQRRESFQGTEQDAIWLDEEPPLDIYTECLMRTMTCDGIVLCTFTPLLGISETVRYFLGDGDIRRQGHVDGRYVVRADWDDAPHLTEAQKNELLASIPPFMRDARSRGIPQLGSGAIYPVPESDIVVADFPVPNFWPQGYGLDVGWNRTAAAWFAKDQSSGTLYVTSEYYRGQAEPVVHATAIRGKGAWMRGVIDPAARARGQKDGEQLLTQYKQLGLNLDVADNSVEAGIGKVWEMLSTGKLKVFRSCQNWLAEFRLYRRDDKGRIVKEMDHLMDATRYFIMSGKDRMYCQPTTHRDRGMSPLVMAR